MTAFSDTPAPAKPRFTVQLARTAGEVLESQRLRYRIFAEELGAELDVSRTARLDRDRFDAHCRHLLVRDAATGRLVASTRLLTDDQAAETGGFYSEQEFELDLLDSLPGHCVEIGRTCVDAAYRSGAVIALLWSGLAEFVQREKLDYLFGCASIGLDDGGANAHAVIERLRTECLAPPYHRAQPRRRLPAPDAPLLAAPKLPPLIKAYMSLGAKMCGDACWDPDFNCADVFMLLNVGELCPRYARRFFGERPNRIADAALA